MNYFFTEDEINYILGVLGTRPINEALPLVNNIHDQYNAQNSEEAQENE